MLFRIKFRVKLKNFVNDYPWKQFFASNFAQIYLTLISLPILVTLSPFTQSFPKTIAIKFQKGAKS